MNKTTPRRCLNNLSHELECMLCDWNRLARCTSDDIVRSQWHSDVVLVIKSLLARAEMMEFNQREIINAGYHNKGA